MSERGAIPVLDLQGKKVREVALSPIFRSEVRAQLIHRAHVIMSKAWHQPKGRDPMAGRRTTATSWGVDRAVSRVPRLETSKSRLAPSVVKGRLAHPPKAEKKLRRKLNKKERLKAVLSAVSATASPTMVGDRGHRVGNVVLPVILDSKVKEMSKTSEVRGLLGELGFSEELKRLDSVKRRSGVSAYRGRRIKARVGPLFIVDEPCPLEKAATNIVGVEVVNAKRLGIRELTPGGKPGRLALWVEPSVRVVEERLMGGNAS